MQNTIREGINNNPMSGYQIKVVIICVIINMLDGFDVLVMAFTAPALAKEWAIPNSELGILFSAGILGMTAGSLFIAPYADKFGRRNIILLCLITISLSMFASVFTKSVSQLTLIRAITGLGIGGMLASMNVLVAEYSSTKYRGLAISVLQSGYPVGAILGGLLSTYLITNYGWQSAFLLGAALSAMMIPVVYFSLPESVDFLINNRPKNTLSKLNKILDKLGYDKITGLPLLSDTAKLSNNSVKDLFREGLAKNTLILWSIFFCIMTTVYFVLSWTPKILVDAGLSMEAGISSSVIMNAGGALGGLVLGTITAKFLPSKVVSAFVAITIVCLVLFGLSTNDLSQAMILATLLGFFLFGSMIGLYTLVPNIYQANIRTTGMGWSIGIGRIGAVLSPLIAGFLLDLSFETSTLFMLYAIPMGVGFVALRFLRAES